MRDYTFANRLKTLREAAGLSERDLAKKLFVTRQAVSKWETGKGLPSPDILVNIANIFNVSTDYLLGRIDTPNNENNDIKEPEPIVIVKKQELTSFEKEAISHYSINFTIGIVGLTLMLFAVFIWVIFAIASGDGTQIGISIAMLILTAVCLGYGLYRTKKFLKEKESREEQEKESREEREKEKAETENANKEESNK